MAISNERTTNKFIIMRLKKFILKKGTHRYVHIFNETI